MPTTTPTKRAIRTNVKQLSPMDEIKRDILRLEECRVIKNATAKEYDVLRASLLARFEQLKLTEVTAAGESEALNAFLEVRGYTEAPGGGEVTVLDPATLRGIVGDAKFMEVAKVGKGDAEAAFGKNVVAQASKTVKTAPGVKQFYADVVTHRKHD